MPAPSDLLSDEDISKAYEDVRSDKSETTWMILKVYFNFESFSPPPFPLANAVTWVLVKGCGERA